MANILVVEDDKVLSDAYSLILERQGHTVTTATNGRQALELADKTPPDIILLDILMPEMDGISFLRNYDVKAKHPDVKVVILSNVGDEKQVEAGMKLGAYKYVLKAQATPEELSVLVNHLIEHNLAKSR